MRVYMLLPTPKNEKRNFVACLLSGYVWSHVTKFSTLYFQFSFVCLISVFRVFSSRNPNIPCCTEVIWETREDFYLDSP